MSEGPLYVYDNETKLKNNTPIEVCVNTKREGICNITIRIFVGV